MAQTIGGWPLHPKSRAKAKGLEHTHLIEKHTKTEKRRNKPAQRFLVEGTKKEMAAKYKTKGAKRRGYKVLN